MRHLLLLLPILCLIWPSARAAEHALHGSLDLRLSATDSAESYLNGGYGKFGQSDGNQFSGVQSLRYDVSFDNNFAVHAIGQVYGGGEGDGAGFTEAYVQYRGLPSRNGLRLQARAGLMYPKVSLENVLTAWASPYTLDYSTLNGWIGEEVRHQGLEASITRLGKFSGSQHDFEIGAALIRGNDPIGAMLGWHGWVTTSRQSLHHDSLPLPELQVGFAPRASKPFIELDNRVGYHLNFQWEWHEHGKLLAGYYDNNADPQVSENLQWAWDTRFSHVGIKWQLPAGVEVIAQYLSGNTLMQSSMTGADLVDNDFRSAYLMLSKELGQHRITARVEEFSVTDRDEIAADNNAEYGKGATLSHRYRINRNWFVQSEYSWLDSRRPSRAVNGRGLDVSETQLQLGLLYFF